MIYNHLLFSVLVCFVVLILACIYNVASTISFGGFQLNYVKGVVCCPRQRPIQARQYSTDVLLK